VEEIDEGCELNLFKTLFSLLALSREPPGCLPSTLKLVIGFISVHTSSNVSIVLLDFGLQLPPVGLLELHLQVALDSPELFPVHKT